MLKIFIDFDETVSRDHVGEALFTRFGGALCVLYKEEYRRGALSAKDCILLECKACGSVPRRALDAFIDDQCIDPTFQDFVRFCSNRELEFWVVSDGLDYYVQRILGKYGIKEFRFYSNELVLEPVGATDNVLMKPSFPDDDEECNRCACCKRNIMLTHAGEEDIIVYVGDGYSGECPALYADIIFAKAKLQVFCQGRNISYHEFRSFDDVQRGLENISSIGHIRKRAAAEANRQALFMAG